MVVRRRTDSPREYDAWLTHCARRDIEIGIEMITLYHAPRTRSIRILWLLEELELPYELRTVEFSPSDKFFTQPTPLGKLPVIEDGAVTMCESGAIIEYIMERYSGGRLAPPIGSNERARYLQWIHFAEGTLYPPVGIVVMMTRYLEDSDAPSEFLEQARQRAWSSLEFVQRSLEGRDYLLGEDFTAADIMMGFSVAAAGTVKLLDSRFASLSQYLARLSQRAAFQKAVVGS